MYSSLGIKKVFSYVCIKSFHVVGRQAMSEPQVTE